MKNSLLKDLKVIDFSYRLPGPFATKILSDLGAEVIKCESPAPFDDPFTHKEIHAIAPNFKSWYKHLNSGKEICFLDQKKNQKEIQKLVDSADVIIIPDSNHFLNFASVFNLQDKVFIRLAAGRGNLKSMHDLNVLSLTKNFSAHYADTKTPPYLPFGGIAFAQYISTYILAAVLAKDYSEHVIYMSDVVPEIFDTLDYAEFSPDTRTLHTGLFPSYALYQTKDGRVLSLAAIEEKFWIKLTECFNLPLTIADRFDTTSRVYKIIEKRFSKLTSNEIQEIVKNQDICLTMN